MKARTRNRLRKKAAAASAAYKARKAEIAAAGGIVAFTANERRANKKQSDQAQADAVGLSLRQWRKKNR